MRTYTVTEAIEGQVVTTHLDTFKEASELMLKINKAGGNSTMQSLNVPSSTSVKPDMVDSFGGSASSPSERRYNRTGRLREGKIDGRH